MNEDEFARRLEAGDSEPGPGDDLRALLADPHVWAGPDPGGAEALLAAIHADQRTRASAADPDAPDVVTSAPGGAAAHFRSTPPSRHSATGTRPRRWVVVAAAAALVVVAGAVGLMVGRGDDGGGGLEGVEFAIAGTPLAPEASAVATVDSKAAGVAIVLQVEGLEAAAPGTYYEAWVAGDGGAVPAGTFHMRGGDGWIYLWSGVDPAEYPTLNVTLEREGGAGGSGEVVLTGPIA
ncbi:MAG TPA: anti-sigma factor [Acidimicrobiales bacterium]|nr:anti-sigma factor [Acidimicrobiales bacterium]